MIHRFTVGDSDMAAKHHARGPAPSQRAWVLVVQCGHRH